jgi:hypothetical protein
MLKDNEYLYREATRLTARRRLKGISLDSFEEFSRLWDSREYTLANEIRIEAKDEGLYTAVSFMNQYTDD